MDTNIQQLSFTVSVNMKAINDSVGPLVLATRKPYRERRFKQPRSIARVLNLSPKERETEKGNRGNLGVLAVEILYLVFESMDVQTFLRVKGVCKSIKAIAENSRAQKDLELIAAVEPKSLSLFMRSGLGSFYTMSILGVFFEKICVVCHGHGDGIFLPTMKRICLTCSENSAETSCICMTTAVEKYSLMEDQINEAHIPLATHALPTGNLKILPEKLVCEYALRVYGSMTRIQGMFEARKEFKMEKYNTQWDKRQKELTNFNGWVKATEDRFGKLPGQWPQDILNYFLVEKARTNKKPKLPRQTFEAKDSTTSGREELATIHLTRKAKIIDRYTGVSERFHYCLGCRENVKPIENLSLSAGGSAVDVRAAQQPYLLSLGELSQHQETCAPTQLLRLEHQRQLRTARLVAVRQAINGEHIWGVDTIPMEF